MSDETPTQSESDGPTSPGGTTSGFETALGKIVVDNGLVTAEELEECNSLLDGGDGEGVGRTLVDLLINHQYVTRRQIERIHTEFDARRSTQRISGYRIIRKLGAGAMATVFLAQQESLDRPVAIKVLPQKFSDNKEFLDRFYKEGRAAAKLNHPNIVQAYDVGQSGDHHYFVMEYVDGETAYEQIVSEKRLGEADAIRIIKQVAAALQHAHDAGFIHRDIKPKNIMISSRGTVKLADLGLARALADQEAAESEAGRAYGTPYYISPEQIRGKVDITPAADIYGLGATCYHMVTGQVPFKGKNPSDVMHRHLKQALTPPDHINPSLSPGLSQVIEMMMAKSVARRYQTAMDVIEDLEMVEQGKTPHFAQPTLDFQMLAETAHSPGPPTPVAAQRPDPAKAAPQPIGLWVLLGISVLANLILLAFVAAA